MKIQNREMKKKRKRGKSMYKIKKKLKKLI